MEDTVVDPLTSMFGLDEVKGMKERGELRLTTPTDPATLLDSSAKVLNDPNWLQNAKGFGHDYPTIANNFRRFEGDGSGLNRGDKSGEADVNYRGAQDTPFPATAPKTNTVSTIDNTVKTTWDTHPFNPFNITPRYLTYDKTEGDKMTE